MNFTLPSRAALQGLIVYAGFVLIFLFFSVMLWDRGFLSAQNLTNIVLQTAPATVLAVGLVFVWGPKPQTIGIPSSSPNN